MKLALLSSAAQTASALDLLSELHWVDNELLVAATHLAFVNANHGISNNWCLSLYVTQFKAILELLSKVYKWNHVIFLHEHIILQGDGPLSYIYSL